MADLIFDAPWWLLVCLVVVGTAIAATGNSRLSKGLRNAGLAVVVLALLLAIFKFTIDTPAKKADRDSRALISAAVNGDWAGFRSLLAPNASLSVLGSPPLYVSAEQLTKAAQEGCERIHLREAHMRYLEVKREGDVIAAEMNLLTEQDLPEAPALTSSWRFEFKQTGHGWLITNIVAEKIGDMPTSDISRQMPAAR